VNAAREGCVHEVEFKENDMDLKATILSIFTGAALIAPTAAFADHDDRRDGRGDRREYHSAHRHSADCEHRPAAPPVNAGRGRYELRAVSTWIEGQWLRDYVPGSCVQKRHRVKCTDGHYVDRWVPAHYAETQQWVWVSYPRVGWNVSVRF
jgi:hypothetical protein